MKALILCNRGIEDISSLEVKEIIKKKSIAADGFIIFDCSKEEELAKLAYLSQSANKVALIIDSAKFNSEEELIKKASELDLKKWLNEKISFRVRAIVKDSGINQEHIEAEVGNSIINSIEQYTQNVDLENPDITLFLFINNNEAYFTIDFSGIDISKRNYRIFSSPNNIKSTIAYAMLRLSGYERGDVLLDTFCLSGSIVIEAALFENSFPVRFFEKDSLIFTKFMKFDFEKIDKKASKDKGKIFAFDSQFKNVDSAKKNAKIAGINKAINFSRLETEWLDTKIEEKTVDMIVTCMPNITKFVNKNDIIKLYNEFFYQAEFVLKDKGTIVISTRNPEEIKECAMKKNLKLEHERQVWQGQEKFWILKLAK